MKASFHILKLKYLNFTSHDLTLADVNSKY